jgi:hypothetical protein
VCQSCIKEFRTSVQHLDTSSKFQLTLFDFPLCSLHTPSHKNTSVPFETSKIHQRCANNTTFIPTDNMVSFSSRKPNDNRTALDVEQLEELILNDLPRICGVARPSRFGGLAGRYHASDPSDHGSASSYYELEEVREYLQDFVNRPISKLAPASVLSEVHSFIGLIHEQSGNTDLALQSHIRALWLGRHTSAGSMSREHLAAIMNGLADAYGRKGDTQNMNAFRLQASKISGGHIDAKKNSVATHIA